jgi:hypothetical protein
VPVMTMRVRVVYVAVVVATLGVLSTCVVVTMGIVVHAVHLLYFTHLSCRAQPGSNESKKHRQVTLSAVSQQNAHRQECLCYQWEV